MIIVSLEADKKAGTSTQNAQTCPSKDIIHQIIS